MEGWWIAQHNIDGWESEGQDIGWLEMVTVSIATVITDVFLGKKQINIFIIFTNLIMKIFICFFPKKTSVITVATLTVTISSQPISWPSDTKTYTLLFALTTPAS
jgi:hypothetical protein